MSITHKDPEWRPADFVQETKYDMEGYNYRLKNNYDQVIDCWARGTEKQVMKIAERTAANLNARDKLYVKENVKQKACTMRSGDYNLPS